MWNKTQPATLPFYTKKCTHFFPYWISTTAKEDVKLIVVNWISQNGEAFQLQVTVTEAV